MMDEEKKDMGQGSMDHSHCCGMCGMHGHRHGLLRLLLGVAILLIVFWLGLKIGELKGEFGGNAYYGGNYGRRMMNYQPMMLWGAPGAVGYPTGMMRATTTPLK